MKRFLALMVCVCVILTAPAAFALSGNTVIINEHTEGDNHLSIESIAYSNGVVYIMDYGKLYTYDGDLKAYKYALESLADGANPNLITLISDGDKVRALVADKIVEDGVASVAAITMYTLSLTPEGTVKFIEPVSIDKYALVESYDGSENVASIYYPFMQNGKLILTAYGDYGMMIMAYDFERGAFDTYEIENIESALPYKDNSVLVCTLSYERAAPECEIYALDLATGDTQRLFALDASKDTPRGFVYDARANDLYYVVSGELFRIQDMNIETKASVNSAKLNSWISSLPVLTDEGAYIVSDYSGVYMRTTDPAQRAARKLAVQQVYTEPLERAYYAFESANQDVEMRFVQRVGDITQALLTRDSSVDIYVLDADSEAYAAMYERGYLAELTSSAKLSALVNDMYPAISQIALKDGELLALPVDLSTHENMGMERKVMERLGISEDELPETWLELFEFFNEFPEIAKEHPDIRLFEAGNTQLGLKLELFYQVMQTRFLQMSYEKGASFDTQEMRDTLKALDNIDFEALGVSEDWDEYADYTGNVKCLMSNYVFVTAYHNTAFTYVPLTLTLGEGEDRMLKATMRLLVVNPFSENVPLAIEFLETVADNMPELTLIEFCENRNTPIPNERYETVIADRIASIEALEVSLQKALEADKAVLADEIRESIQNEKQSLEEYRVWGKWSVSPESIAQYRQYAKYIIPFKNTGVKEDDSADISVAIEQYLIGEIDSETMLREVDRKIKMMMLEGV